eukprot:CAMPEP_0118866712 /NCGR_PEP_ID=MMETSP1163-20130328/10527_1 /TAXON_ID=124430 /ORGANISM="Phaeomonas parva, Strain CCMP2877" /LENGTH=327 /DNA_ID=CAMNT_0006801053 /DNA_START=170 /DNA_END=1150 /DNA_ORIENTATION=-
MPGEATMAAEGGVEAVPWQPKHIIHDDSGTILADAEPVVPLTADQTEALEAALLQFSVEQTVEAAAETGEAAGADEDAGPLVVRVVPRGELLKVVNATGDNFAMTEAVLEAWLSKDAHVPAFAKEEYSVEEARAIVQLLNANSTRYGARLRLCAGRNHLALITEYLQRGVDPNTADASGRTSLHVAGELGEADSIKHLYDLAKGRLIVDAKDKYGWTPLMSAAAYGKVSTTRLLLDLKANIGATNNEGRTALHWACAKGRADVVRLLLVRPKVPTKAVDLTGRTALHCAVFAGHANIVKILLEAKVDESVKDMLGRTARDYADERFW